MKTKRIILVALLAAGAGWAFAKDSSVAKPESRVSVVLVNPEKFTDAKMDSWGNGSADILNRLQTFMQETGNRYVPTGMHLEIKVTDVDLAGEFEPWRGHEFTDIRILRSIYMPRINLQFRLTDSKGAVVSSGARELEDQAYQWRNAWPQDDYLRYEKDMLRDWFSQEFRGLKPS